MRRVPAASSRRVSAPWSSPWAPRGAFATDQNGNEVRCTGVHVLSTVGAGASHSRESCSVSCAANASPKRY